MTDIDLDSFAGGGGASTGVHQALNKPVDIAINHSEAAIAMHRANHPETQHYCESIWTVNPREACRGKRVRVAWFSPDCTHFSRAKGGNVSAAARELGVARSTVRARRLHTPSRRCTATRGTVTSVPRAASSSFPTTTQRRCAEDSTRGR